MNEQLSLFDKQDDKIAQTKKRKPRNQKLPVHKPKSTQAIASSFGWLFQIVSAIILSLMNIKDLEKVKVEGQTEDIELYFKHRYPIYIQAKATSKNLDTNIGIGEKCKDALNTLINTSNLHKNYSQLIYISNYLNPLNLPSRIADAQWNPKSDQVFQKVYTQIPPIGQKYLYENSQRALKDLSRKGYLSDTSNFNWKKLVVATLAFERNENSQTQNYEALERQIKLILGKNQDINVENSIKTFLIALYHDNATKCQTTISKEDLFWVFVIKYIEFAPNYFLEHVQIMQRERVKNYSNGFISKQVLNIRIINRVLHDFNQFNKTNNTDINAEQALQTFLDTEWSKFKNDFPIKNTAIQRDCIKNMIYKILYKGYVISDLKKGFKINDHNKNNN